MSDAKLNLDEAADRLGMSASGLRKLAESGKISARFDEGRWTFSARAIEAFQARSTDDDVLGGEGLTAGAGSSDIMDLDEGRQVMLEGGSAAEGPGSEATTIGLRGAGDSGGFGGTPNTLAPEAFDDLFGDLGQASGPKTPVPPGKSDAEFDSSMPTLPTMAPTASPFAGFDKEDELGFDLSDSTPGYNVSGPGSGSGSGIGLAAPVGAGSGSNVGSSVPLKPLSSDSFGGMGSGAGMGSGVGGKGPLETVPVSDEDEDEDIFGVPGDIDISASGPASGINLASPADTGVGLEEDSEFDLSLEGDSAGDVFETDDFEVPGFKDADEDDRIPAGAGVSSRTQATTTAAKRDDDDSGSDSDFELAIDEEGVEVEESDSEVVAIDEGSDEEGEEGEDDDEDEGELVGAGRGVAAAPAPWDALSIGVIFVNTLVLPVVGIMMLEMLRHSWSTTQPYSLSATVIDQVNELAKAMFGG